MASVRAWDGVAPEARWATDVMDEMLDATTRSPEYLLAYAEELRQKASATDIEGYRDGYLRVADRYEQAAQSGSLAELP